MHRRYAPDYPDTIALAALATGLFLGSRARKPRRRPWVPPTITPIKMCRQERRRLERAGKLVRR